MLVKSRPSWVQSTPCCKFFFAYLTDAGKVMPWGARLSGECFLMLNLCSDIFQRKKQVFLRENYYKLDFVYVYLMSLQCSYGAQFFWKRSALQKYVKTFASKWLFLTDGKWLFRPRRTILAAFCWTYLLKNEIGSTTSVVNKNTGQEQDKNIPFEGGGGGGCWYVDMWNGRIRKMTKNLNYFTENLKTCPCSICYECVQSQITTGRFSCSASRSPKHLVAVTSAFGFVEEFFEEEPVIKDEEVVEDLLPLFFIRLTWYQSGEKFCSVLYWKRI